MQFTHRFLIAAVCLGLLAGVVVFGVRRRTTPMPTAGLKPEQAKFEVERITLREWGFEPKQIDRRPGPFLLVLQNQSGLPEVELSLIAESGHMRQGIPDTRNALTWKQRLELPPGTYLIKEAGHPDWQCQITIGNMR